jgi:hypothetical protein
LQFRQSWILKLLADSKEALGSGLPNMVGC